MISTRMKVGVVVGCLFTCVGVPPLQAAPPATQPAAPWTAVKLHVKNVTARQALDELTRQTQVAFAGEIPAFDDRLNDVRVTLDLEGQPLMSAVVAVCDAADLRPVGYTSDRQGIRLGTSEGALSLRCSDVRGPFAVGVIRTEQNLRIDYGTRPNSNPRMFWIRLCICPEPALHAQRVTDVHLTKCLDETNFPVADLGQPVASASVPGAPALQIRCMGDRLSLVEGEFTAVIEKERKHIEVPDVTQAHDVGQTLGQARLQIRSFTRNGRLYVLQVLVPRGDMDDDQLARLTTTLTNTRPMFLSASGKDTGLQQISAQTRAVPSGSMVVLMYQPVVGREEPAKLVWDVPTDTVEVKVPFSIRDVPLPGPPMPANKAVVLAPATLPAVAKIDVDKEVKSLLPQLAAVTDEERQDALIQLGLLPPTAFATVEKIADDASTPPAARQQLKLYLQQRRPLQEARLRRAKVVEEERNWEEAAALDAYGRFGKRDPKWDAKVREAIHQFYQSEGVGAKADSRHALEAAVEAGCEDPLVVSLTGFAIEKTGGNPRQVLKLYQQAHDDIRTSQYPDYFRLSNAIRYYNLLYRTSSAEVNFRGERVFPREDAQALSQLRSGIALQFADAARIKPPPSLLLDTAQRVIDITGAGDEKAYARVSNIMESLLPNRPEPLILKGEFYTDFAWVARGSGTADTVTDRGWKLFTERLAVAEESLKKAYELDPTDPRSSTAMLSVELGQGKGRDVMETWYKRAMEADPDNLTACERKLYYLEPKWHGSAEDMLAFGEECYKSGNYLGRLPTVLMLAHKSLSRYLHNPEAYLKQDVVWRDARRVYEPYLRVRPDDTDARSAYTYYACVSGHWAVAKEQFDLLGDNIMPIHFGHGSIEDVKEFKKKAQAAKSDGL
jgi:hypothetical protein